MVLGCPPAWWWGSGPHPGVWHHPARSQQERDALQKRPNKPRKNELGKELPTEKAILEDKCNLRI